MGSIRSAEFVPCAAMDQPIDAVSELIGFGPRQSPPQVAEHDVHQQVLLVGPSPHATMKWRLSQGQSRALPPACYADVFIIPVRPANGLS